MRLSVVLLLIGMLGVVGGAVLIARWAVGVAIICDSLALGAYGLTRDVPDGRKR